MKYLKDLWLDQQLVEAANNNKVDEALLYQQLSIGKITLKEYLRATKK